MRWKQVCQTALAFSASRGASIVQSKPHTESCLTLLPLRGTAKISVERSNQDAESWYVRLTRKRQGPVYFPPVSTPEALSRTLSEAWVTNRCLDGIPDPPDGVI